MRKLFRKLFPQKTETDFPKGYFPLRFFEDVIDGGPILIIGDWEGKEYRRFKDRFEIKLLDVVDNGIVKDLILQSVEDPIPFPDGYFKYVILSEVIAQVWEDKKSLENINKVLASDGRLLISTPLYHDCNEYYYHMYSPKAVEVLLRYSGFAIDKYRFTRLNNKSNLLIGFLALLLYPRLKERALLRANDIFYKFHRPRGGKGMLISARKANKEDAIKDQQKRFTIQ